jgi:PAS domain-containing protein
MGDKEKTKSQLIDELNSLGQQNAELERVETEPAQAEGLPAEFAKRYKDFLANLSDIAYETDASGNVTYANKAARE